MAEEKIKKSGGISRRTFLKGLGGGVAGAATLPATGLLGKETATAIFGPEAETLSGSQKIQLSINGKTMMATVEPRTTLLSVLRHQLELTGAKEVCDRGQCGACTVIIDGKTQLSCMTLALDARGKKITTVEGLAEGDALHAVQEAFVEKDALMCGFCTPGFVMSGTALLQANPNPTMDEIKNGVSGNLCRCGTYPKVFEAIETAAQNMRKGG
jgi:aerobic-type carbon monoxide dehydrogenase small subunit (CoxS/CutS family)